MDGIAQGVLLAERYAVGDVLGSGGSSRVHRAHDRLLGRDVALKVFPPGTDPGRVRDEVRTLAAFNHPGLVGVHDAGEAPDGTAFLVMELVEGTDLARCCLDGSLPPGRVAEVGAQVAAALAHVHAHGVVHRDVKPANVLLGDDGRTRLADFGTARVLEAERRTATGMLHGTAAYLSPEQVRGEAVGPPTDVFALGLLLLEALTGRREYPGHDVEAAVARLTRPPRVPDDLPAPWPGLLRAMTAADPAARPGAGDVATALSAPTPAPPVPTQPTAARPRDAGRDRAVRGGLARELAGDRVVWVLGGSLLLVLLVLGGLVAVLDDGSSPGAAPAGTSAAGQPDAAGQRDATEPTAPAEPEPEPAEPAPAPAVVPVAGVSLFHPGGSDDDDPQDAPLAVDGDVATAWTTQRYASREFGGLRPGVGLRLDLGAPQPVSAVRVRLPLPGADLRVHAGDDGSDALVQTPPVATSAGAGERVALELPETVTARYWVVWIERLPAGGRASISEIALTPG